MNLEEKRASLISSRVLMAPVSDASLSIKSLPELSIKSSKGRWILLDRFRAVSEFGQKETREI
ncbi:hypothetical protein [Gemmiger sp.]|uniref:hypothetical protein n=1 Tax=Gemmiger sp. TaxID=2049027 RepID=UPI003F07918D